MRIIFAILFCPVFCFSQGSAAVVTKDTTYQQAANGRFYEVRRVEWSTGAFTENRTLIGDTATVFKFHLTSFILEANRMANAAYEARAFDREIRAMIKKRDTVLAQTGQDVTDTITQMYSAPLLQSGWTISDDTSSLDITFSVNGQGQLRYEIAGHPVRNAFLFGRAMRLINYRSTGASVDLYSAPGGNWFSIDDRVKMRLPGNQGLRRSAIKAPKSQKSGVLLEYFMPSAGSAPTFYAGDSVTLKKSGSKYIVTVQGKTFELVQKK